MRRFDFVIGNPAYQAETIGENDTYAPPVYHLFLEEAYKIGDTVEMVHPARFLFNAGSTPKQWNQKMLNDTHLKVLKYEAEANKVFPNTNINGGVAITYRSANSTYGAIEVFAQFVELNTIRRKVVNAKDFRPFSNYVFSAYSYHLTESLYDDHPELKGKLSDGHDYDLKSNILDLMPQVFSDAKRTDNDIQILGRQENTRVFKWVNKKYITGPANWGKYKVFLAAADGAAGTIGKPIPARIIGVPVNGEKWSGSTESFISIGSFETMIQAQNAIKYIQTRFARSLLSLLKITQHITPDKWLYVPQQDFTSSSDINWNTSIANIDRQLYKKYGLSQEEIDFIETHVKEMT